LGRDLANLSSSTFRNERVYARFDRITARQCIARCTVFIRGFGDVRLGRRQQDTLNSNTHETRG